MGRRKSLCGHGCGCMTGITFISECMCMFVHATHASCLREQKRRNENVFYICTDYLELSLHTRFNSTRYFTFIFTLLSEVCPFFDRCHDPSKCSTSFDIIKNIYCLIRDWHTILEQILNSRMYQKLEIAGGLEMVPNAGASARNWRLSRSDTCTP